MLATCPFRLLIGCANVANLLLTRSTVRARDVGMRATLGATPARIVRALLVESLLLSLMGGATGVALAVGATRAFKALAPPGTPRVADVAIDARVLAFAFGVSLLTTLVCGLAPALRASRMNLAQMLREGGRPSGRRTGRLSRVLVATELALATVLVAAGGMLTRSFLSLTAWQPGFEREHLLTFSVFAPTASYRGREELVALIKSLETEIGAIPGVTAVATASAGPLFGGRETWEMEVDNRGPDSRASIRWHDASPSYFATFGVPIVRGRALAETDVGQDAFVGVVNETLARRLWPTTDPLGHTLTFGVGTDRAVFTVVGVAKDMSPIEPGQPVEPHLYWSNRQIPRPFTYVIARTTVPPASLTANIRERVALMKRGLEARSIAPYASHVDRALTTPRFTMSLVATFGIAALVFAAIGTYGLLNYVAAQRSREIAIRLALGARRRQILGGVMGAGVSLAAIGSAIGLVAALIATRLVSAQFAGVRSLDPVALLGAAVMLLTVAAVASGIPAWRASRVDPAMTLSSE